MGQKVLPPRAAESKGRQNECLKWERNWFSALNIFQIIATSKNLIQWVIVISFRSSIVIARSWRQEAQLRYCLDRTEQPGVKAIWKLCMTLITVCSFVSVLLKWWLCFSVCLWTEGRTATQWSHREAGHQEFDSQTMLFFLTSLTSNPCHWRVTNQNTASKTVWRTAAFNTRLQIFARAAVSRQWTAVSRQWAAVSRLNECFPAEAPSTERKKKYIYRIFVNPEVGN